MIRHGVLALVALWLSGCSNYADRYEKAATIEQRSAEQGIPLAPAKPQRRSRTLAEIREQGRLVVLTRNAPTTYYLDQHGLPVGPEYELAEAFGEHIGVKPEYLVLDSIRDILRALKEGRGDLVAAGITATPKRRKRLDFGPEYQQVTQQVVCAPGAKPPKKIADMVGLDVRVIASSSYADKLADLKIDHPDLGWTEVEDQGTELLLEELADQKFDCTVADSNIVDINRRYHPELLVGFNLTKPEGLAWVVPKERPALQLELKAWWKKMQKSGDYAEIAHRYYGHIRKFDYVEHSTFIERVDKRLPRYQKWFEQAAEQQEFPMTLLAAQGYQESHWNPNAVSPTGVRGLMMLTRITAKAMGVRNRTDPQESIRGGAKYLRQMHRRQKDESTEPDRTWLALAAYNVGLGHLRDAQTLARRAGKDANKWSVIQEMLPLLTNKQYYKTLKYGYARGREPVVYVRNIRDYQDVLEQQLGMRG